MRTYQTRKAEEGYAKRVGLKEIAEKNDYNLNISRYVSTTQKEKEINLAETHAELVRLDAEVREATKRHNVFLK
jgi:type I restriction enzyme M protein